MTMDRRRVMMWLMLIGSVMFTAYTLWPSGKGAPVIRPATAANAPAAATAAAATPATPVTSATAMPEKEWVAWRAQLRAADRDPFYTAAEIAAMNRPAVIARAEAPPAAPAPAYVVKLVLMSGSEGRAMIGNQVVQVGDMLGQERVAEIRRDGVVLEKGGARRHLDLAKGGPKAPPTQQESKR
jgi:hypothetical protein